MFSVALILTAILFGTLTSAEALRPRVATVLFVSPTGDDNNDGTETKPYKTIQAAINNASAGDTVTLTDGTYSGNGNRDLDCGGKSLTIKSQHGAEKTIIDCGGTETTNHRGFNFHTKEDKAIIRGLTVKNGYERGGGIFIETNCKIEVSDCNFIENSGGGIAGGGVLTVSNCNFEANKATAFTSEGGGLSIFSNGTAVVKKCIFKKNVAETGGGANCNGILTDCQFIENTSYRGGGGFFGTADLSNCIFIGNKSQDDNGGGASGSGILTRCTFTKNISEYGGGGLNWFGTIDNCIFNENRARSDKNGGWGSGGAILGAGKITNCTISKNIVVDGDGGGVYITSDSTIMNCLIVDNTAVSRYRVDSGWRICNGGGVSTSGGSSFPYHQEVTLMNCTISGNKTAIGDPVPYNGETISFAIPEITTNPKGGGVVNRSTMRLIGCIIWGNEAPDSSQIATAKEGTAQTTLTYSNIQGGLSGEGNIKADPLFVDPQNGDFHLKPGSPCIGTGIAIADPAPTKPKTPVKPGAKPVAAPKTAKVPSPTELDLDGKPRPVKPSLGAYEGAKTP